LKFPDNCGFFITDICIPNTFKTVEEGISDSLYIRYDFYPDVKTKYDIITIPSRNYTGATLAAELQTLLNTSVKKFYPGLSTAGKFIWIFSCTYDLNTNTFNISSKLTESNLDARNSWSILTDTTMNTLTG
jgi:hypothetical protein